MKTIFRNIPLLTVSLGILGMFPDPGEGATLVFKEGFEVICEVHSEPEDNWRFRYDPNFVEIVMGGMTQKVSRDRIREIRPEPEYTAPERGSAREKQERDQLVQILQGGGAGNATTDTGTSPAGTAGAQKPLIAEVAFLRGYAATGSENLEESRAVKEGDVIPPGQTYVTKRNSRSTLRLENKVRLGFASSTRVRFRTVEKRAQGTQVLYFVDLRLTEGKIWIEVANLDVNERVKLVISDWSCEVNRYTLMSVETLFGSGFSLSYLEGQTNLSVAVPGRSGFVIDLNQRINFTSNPNQPIEKLAIPLDAKREWEDWELFVPKPILLEPRAVYPKPYPIASGPIQFDLRKVAGMDSLESQPLIRSNILQDLDSYRSGLDRFQADVGRYPTQAEGLAVLRSGEGIASWNGPYVDKDLPRQDPWGEVYLYRLLGGADRPTVYSPGPNTLDELGLGDDVH